MQWLTRERAVTPLYGVLDPRLFLNTCNRKRLGVTGPDSNGHVCRPRLNLK